MVKVAVPLLVPFRLTWALAGVQLKVGGRFEPGLFVIAAERVTAPVNPPDGVTVIVDVFPEVAPAVRVTVVPEIVKLELQTGFTTRVTESVREWSPRRRSA